jgi:hypothetical protein
MQPIAGRLRDHPWEGDKIICKPIILDQALLRAPLYGPDLAFLNNRIRAGMGRLVSSAATNAQTSYPLGSILIPDYGNYMCKPLKVG